MGEATTDDVLLQWRVGAVTVTRVPERVTAVPHGAVISTLTPELVDADRPWISPFVATDGRLVLSVHSFVVVSAGVTIVVDTCVGPHGDRPLPHDPGFAARLDDAVDGGLDAVDVVLCTHLHFDHVGWNTRRGADGELVPTFPNATYLVAEAELAALDGHDHQAIGPVSIAPLAAAGVLRPVTTDHRVTAEVRLVPTPGHTPGHVSVAIESEGSAATITGDVVHSPIQLAHPDLTADRFDRDPEAATCTRRRFVDDHLDRDVIVLGTHFPPPTGGRIVSTEHGVAFEPS